MKFNTVLKHAALALTSFLMIPAAQAQSDMHFRVPFAYYASGKILPAGEYRVETDMGSRLVQLRNKDAHAGMFTLAQPTEGTKVQEIGKLTFVRIGDTYFLRKVWLPGYKAGLQLPTSKKEIELRASTHQQRPENVVLAAMR